MKMKSIYRMMMLPAAVALILAACTKETSEVRLDTTLATAKISSITANSAIVQGFLVAQGDGITEKGICYDKAAGPTTAKSKTIYTGTLFKAAFPVTLTKLDYATKYYARAYAIGPAGTFYGEEMSFTTLPVVPTLTTAAVTAITGNSATGGGEVTVLGGADITARGICWAVTENPTVAGSKTVDPNPGLGAFTGQMTGLLGNKTYYVRAYATNSAGTGYGPQVSFKTDIDLPAVTTTDPTDITKTSAVSGGNVTYDGGGTISARGLCWSMNANPSVTDNVIAGGTGTGSFVSNLTGLTLYTTYHVRAYATNSKGTVYGSDKQFTTLANTRTWNVPGDYVAASYPGTTYANWSPGSSPQVKSTITAPDAIEGYVYMAGASNQWKFATQNDWSGPNYGAGSTPGTLSETGDNIVSPAGYYKINVNAAVNPMTYTAVNTVWGVIGDLTSWSSQLPLTYDPALRIWKGAIHMPVGGWKFRANNDWGYNYGAPAGSNALVAGGDNIATTLEDDYAITLDLSHPNEYTYRGDRWGIIGSATPGGWGSDENMSWDAANGVFTITLPLTAGDIKFRANDDWGYNLGGPLGALVPGGSNIPVAAGNYKITLNPWTFVATVTAL
jgi:starch-binding outer membrane protein SusE/F